MRTAVRAVAQACRLAQAVRAALVNEDTAAKKDRSPVTVADFGVQALISATLEASFPDDPFMAEEDAAELGAVEGLADIRRQVVHHVRALRPEMTEAGILKAIDRGSHPGGPDGRFWVLDPIDGTKGFIRGDQYAIALALVEKGRVGLGVLGCPNLPAGAGRPLEERGCLFYAGQGRGAGCMVLAGEQDGPIQVSTVQNPAEASFCESFESAHSAHDWSTQAAVFLGVAAPPVRMDSQAKYGAVARGDAAIYLRLPTRPGYEEKVWDHAAGALIVEEAGGRVTDIHGDPLDFTRGRTLAQNKGVVASNGLIHEQILEAVHKAAPKA